MIAIHQSLSPIISSTSASAKPYADAMNPKSLAINSRPTVSISLSAASKSACSALNSRGHVGEGVQRVEIGGVLGLDTPAKSEQNRDALVHDMIGKVSVAVHAFQELVTRYLSVLDGHRRLSTESDWFEIAILYQATDTYS